MFDTLKFIREAVPTNSTIGFVLIIAIVAAVVFGVLAWVVDRNYKSHQVERPSEKSLREVVGRTFRNETVPLDGYIYTDCVFQDVTFRWDGGNTAIRGAQTKVIGHKRFETFNETAVATVDLLQSFGFLESEFSSDWKHVPAEVR
jgi:hypothetical protein